MIEFRWIQPKGTRVWDKAKPKLQYRNLFNLKNAMTYAENATTYAEFLEAYKKAEWVTVPTVVVDDDEYDRR